MIVIDYSYNGWSDYISYNLLSHHFMQLYFLRTKQPIIHLPAYKVKSSLSKCHGVI